MNQEGAAELRQRLRTLDDRIAKVAVPMSLAPGCPRARSLDAIAGVLLAQRDADWRAAFATTAEAVVNALIEHFPGNLYWDLDFLIAALLEQAESPAALVEQGAAVARLQAVFGRHSAIRFRYLHDFSYGFDWARWVARRPAERSSIGPFAPTFLNHIERRGIEMAAAISAGDPRFPALAPDAYRNPFPFSRAPCDERRLFEDLAARRLIPIEAWRSDARPSHDRPFATLREERARALGIPAACEGV